MEIKSIIREIELSKVLDHPLEGDALVIQTFFDELFNGLEIDTLDGYPDSIFFVKNGYEVYMEQDYKFEKLYCSYIKIWLSLRDKFNFNDREVSDLIKYMVEQQLKSKVFTPRWSSPTRVRRVEQQLKNKVFTPHRSKWKNHYHVEQQLKSKVFTPCSIRTWKNFLVEQQLKNKVSVSYGDTEKVEEDNLI